MRTLILFAFLFGAAGALAQSPRALDSFDKGIERSQKGDHVAAHHQFESTLALAEREGASDRFFGRLHYNIGVSLFQLERFGAAQYHLKKALRFTNHLSARAHHVLGLTMQELGDWNGAGSSLRTAVALDDRNGEAWFDLGMVMLQVGNDRMALTAFDRAIRHRSTERSASYNNIGVLLAARGELAEAMVQFTRAAALDTGGVAAQNLEKCRRYVGLNDKKLLADELKISRRGTANRT